MDGFQPAAIGLAYMIESAMISFALVSQFMRRQRKP